MRTALVASVLCVSAASAVDYFPLKEGNQWNYTMSNGLPVTMRVSGFENVGSVRCAVLDTTVAGQTTREYMTVDSQGVKSHMSQMQGQQFRYDPPVLRIKLPYRQGDTWQANINQMGMAMTTSFRSAGQERIQTPAGTFDCIKVQSSMDMGGQSMAATIWYADGIGQVHQVMQMAGQEITVTLASTNVKPAPAQTVTTPVQESRSAPTAQPATGRPGLDAPNETTNQAARQAVELNETSEIEGFLVALGYLPTKGADGNACKKALQTFAESHFEGDVAAFRSAEVLKKHLSYAAGVFRMRKAGDSSLSELSVLAQYRVGISAYGCISYVIGGCYASLPTSLRDSLNNELIPSVRQRLAPGKEIEIRILDTTGDAYVTDIMDAPADPEVAMFFWSKKMSRFPIAGHVVPSPRGPTRGFAPMYQVFDKELVRILDIKGDEIAIAGQFLEVSQKLYERTMKVTENMDIVVCESKYGATKEGPHITFKEFRNMIIPWELALISGDDRDGWECNKLYIYRPASVIVEGKGPRVLDTAIAAAYREGSSHALTLEQTKTVAASGVCPPEITGIQRQDLLLTLAIAVRLLPSKWGLSVPEIQPDSTGDPLILVPHETTNVAHQLDVNLEIEEVAGLAKVTNVGGLVLPPGSSRLADAFVMTQGDSLANTETRRSNVRSYLTVRTMLGSSSWVLATELPKETVPYSMSDGRGLMGRAKALIPNGEGSIFRFRGTLKDFFPGWTIHADDKEPLCFVLLRGEGLTYLLGKGYMIGPGDRRLEFEALSQTNK